MRRRAAPSRAARPSLRALTAPSRPASQSVARAIAAVRHEGQPFAVGDQAVGEREGLQQRLVARPLVVEGEAVAVVADLDDAAVERREASVGVRPSHRRVAAGRRDRRAQRAAAKRLKMSVSTAPDAAARG